MQGLSCALVQYLQFRMGLNAYLGVRESKGPNTREPNTQARSRRKLSWQHLNRNVLRSRKWWRSSENSACPTSFCRQQGVWESIFHSSCSLFVNHLAGAGAPRLGGEGTHFFPLILLAHNFISFIVKETSEMFLLVVLQRESVGERWRNASGLR